MITMKELNPHNRDVTPEQLTNLQELLRRINIIRTLWNMPMIVTSGFRTKEDQERINPHHMSSQHMNGNAVDILDQNGDLQEWVLSNVPYLVSFGLWCEDFSATPHWVHFQQISPASGHRFFKP